MIFSYTVIYWPKINLPDLALVKKEIDFLAVRLIPTIGHSTDFIT